MQKHLQEKALTLFWFPVKDIKIPDIFYKILPRNVKGFSSRAQRFTGSNYLYVNSPLRRITQVLYNKYFLSLSWPSWSSCLPSPPSWWRPCTCRSRGHQSMSWRPSAHHIGVELLGFPYLQSCHLSFQLCVNFPWNADQKQNYLVWGIASICNDLSLTALN